MTMKETLEMLLEDAEQDLQSAKENREQAYSQKDFQSASFYGGQMAEIEIMMNRIKWLQKKAR